MRKAKVIQNYSTLKGFNKGKPYKTAPKLVTETNKVKCVFCQYNTEALHPIYVVENVLAGYIPFCREKEHNLNDVVTWKYQKDVRTRAVHDFVQEHWVLRFLQWFGII